MIAITQTRSARRRGSLLMTSIILLIVAAVAAITLLNFTIGMGHLTEKRTDAVKAFYISESGVNHVYQFFNHPEDFQTDEFPNEATLDPHQRLFFYVTDQSDPDYGTFPNLEDYLENNDELIIVDAGDSTQYLTFNDASGNFLGQVTSLKIIKPENSDPVECIGKIRSVGETRSSKAGKQEKTIMLYFNPGIPPVMSPAAIISHQSAGFNGSVKPHWGEVWSKFDVNLQNGFSKNDVENYLGTAITDRNDPWTKARTEGQFYTTQGTPQAYFDGRYHNDTLTQPNNPDYRRFTPIADTEGAYYTNPMTNVSWGSGINAVDMTNRFEQHQNLSIPQFNYNLWKKLAQERGSYYSTEIVGGQTVIYRNGIETPANQVINFNAEFFTNEPNTSFRLIFIDTLDGNPPAADGTNLGTISFNGGTNPHLRGVFYANANMGITGMGNPPTLNVERPDESTTNLSKVWIDGILFTAGGIGTTTPGAGNFQIYGSLVALGDITINGSPDVWYNHRLKDGSYFPVNSRVSVVYFKIL